MEKQTQQLIDLRFHSYSVAILSPFSLVPSKLLFVGWKSIFDEWVDKYMCEYINVINIDSYSHCISSSANSPYRDKIRAYLNSGMWSYVLYSRTSDKRKNLAKQKAEAQRRLYGQNSIKRPLPGSSDWEQQRHQLEKRKEELVWKF